MLNRYGSVDEVINTISLMSLTFSIVVYRKQAAGVDETNRLVTETDTTGNTIMRARDCVMENMSWSVATGGIATTDISGRYKTPMTMS